MLALNWQNRAHYAALMRLDRPIGTYLVMWPSMWALWLAAKGVPDFRLLVVFLLGAFLMRSAGCVINDFADRELDGQVQRTQDRPLAQKRVSNAEALQLFTLLCATAALLLLFTNRFAALLAIIAVALAIIYPFMKRYTHLPQVVLGMAFSWSIPMAYAAQAHNLPLLVWYLYAAVVCWVIAYDTFYAMVDRKDDLAIGIKSTAILFGRYDQLVCLLLQIVCIALLFFVGQLADLGNYYRFGLAAAALLFAYQQWLISNSRSENYSQACFKAFLNNHLVGMVIFIGILLDYY